jgi:hypothetical protein
MNNELDLLKTSDTTGEQAEITDKIEKVLFSNTNMIFKQTNIRSLNFVIVD